MLEGKRWIDMLRLYNSILILFGGDGGCSVAVSLKNYEHQSFPFSVPTHHPLQCYEGPHTLVKSNETSTWGHKTWGFDKSEVERQKAFKGVREVIISTGLCENGNLGCPPSPSKTKDVDSVVGVWGGKIKTKRKENMEWTSPDLWPLTDQRGLL